MWVTRFLRQRLVYSLATLGTLFALIGLPGLVPMFASADQVTTRSVQLSSSAATATNVSYHVKFTVSSHGAGAYVVDFCDNSPIPGDTCTAPTGFSAASVSTTTASTTVAALPSNTGVLVTQTVAGSGNADVTLDGLTNPTSPTDGTANNGFYARIITYASAGDAASYVANDLGASSPVDEGGVAIAITNAIGINATVMESMLFCAAKVTITANCANAAANAPSLKLGETVGSTVALTPTAISTGDIYTQISTNAATGAIVRLNSNATSCGGLIRSGATGACDIGPAPTGGFAAGVADFGLKTGSASATSGVTTAGGTLEPVTGSGYNSSTYFMNYVAGNATGVTSPYGDPLLDTDGAPINNENMPLTFGASISNNTPAGNYSADLGLIASGTY